MLRVIPRLRVERRTSLVSGKLTYAVRQSRVLGFHTIANRRDTTAQSLSAFLHTTHRTEDKLYTMPDPRLTDDMIGDVASYIMSLRDHP